MKALLRGNNFMFHLTEMGGGWFLGGTVEACGVCRGLDGRAGKDPSRPRAQENTASTQHSTNDASGAYPLLNRLLSRLQSCPSPARDYISLDSRPGRRQGWLSPWRCVPAPAVREGPLLAQRWGPVGRSRMGVSGAATGVSR